MPLEKTTDENTRYCDLDGGSCCNISETKTVLRHLPSRSELKNLFKEFSEAINHAVFDLLSMEYPRVYERYGNLGLNSKEAAGRETGLYAFITLGVDPRFCNVRKRAVTQALIHLGHLPATTPHGRKRQNATRGSGSVAGTVKSLSQDQQLELLKALVWGGFDLDDWLLFDGGTKSGMGELALRLRSVRDHSVEDFLHELVGRVEALVDDASRRTTESGGTAISYEYATAWFAQFLCTKGIWHLPLRYYNGVRRFYPRRLLPLTAWMSVPAHSRDIADRSTLR